MVTHPSSCQLAPDQAGESSKHLLRLRGGEDEAASAGAKLRRSAITSDSSLLPEPLS